MPDVNKSGQGRKM